MDNVVDQENYEKAVDDYDHFLVLRYFYLMNEGEKLWPESPSV